MVKMGEQRDKGHRGSGMLFLMLAMISAISTSVALENDGTRTKHGECDAANGACASDSVAGADEVPSCDDTHERCPVWASEGECRWEAIYMNEHCPKSCGKCPGVAGVATDATEKTDCKDSSAHCGKWAALGQCKSNSNNMNEFCPETCGVCGMESPTCVDTDTRCPGWADSGECEANPRWMKQNCQKSCQTCMPTLSPLDAASKAKLQEASKAFGEAQRIDGMEAPQTLEVVRKSVDYMTNDVLGKNPTQNLPERVKKSCQNRNELCAFWAVIGECEKNQAYMVTNCAPSCQSCHLIDFDKRCPPPDASIEPGLKPGDLNKMFERIVETAPGNRTLSEDERKALQNEGLPEYTVTVHSRPSLSSNTEISEEIDKKLPPWVITFDNFLSEEECQYLIDRGYKEGYKRSEDVGAEKFDGTFDGMQSKRRTSENAWCGSQAGCRSDAKVTEIHERIAKVLHIPANNSEDLQILKYEVGQFYRVHHDYIFHQKNRQSGPRILTFFLYLSDVEAGGGTGFPDLNNLTVMPKRGRALLWPSILNSDPKSEDRRMMHEALTVEGGTKFAANAWIHLNDYVTPQKTGCN